MAETSDPGPPRLPFELNVFPVPRAVIPPLVAPLPEGLRGQLSAIVPSRMGSLELYPCEATLQDGTVVPRLYLAEAQNYIGTRGSWPWESRGMRWVPAETILSVRECPTRLPPLFANELYREGESGMGYTCFSLRLRNGLKHYFLTGNAVDFPTWPEGVSPSEVIECTPGDRHHSPLGGAAYAWAPFCLPPSPADDIITIRI